MTRDERLKKYQEAGAEFVEAARAKAEEILHDVSSVGEASSGRASATIDDLVGGGKRGTDQLLDAVRREIAAQLKALGVATTSDLDALERRLSGKAPVKRAAAKKTAPAAKKTAPAATKTAAASNKTVARKAAPVKKTAGSVSATATGTVKKAAGTTRKAAKKAATTAG